METIIFLTASLILLGIGFFFGHTDGYKKGWNESADYHSRQDDCKIMFANKLQGKEF